MQATKPERQRQLMISDLPIGIEIMLAVLHSTIEKVKPASDKGIALRRAIGQLSEHATRRLKGLPWPPSEQAPPAIRSIAPREVKREPPSSA